MAKWMMSTGAGFALLAVAAGAFGAHALKSRLTPDMLAVFETAARYQMYHALALVLLGVVSVSRPMSAWTSAGIAMVVGIVLFSGSLYVLSLTGIRWLGAITPLGGTAFMAGWALFAWGAIRL